MLKHGRSKPHQESVNALRDPKSRKVDEIFRRTDDTLNDKVKEAEIKIAAFLAEHNIAFNVMDHLSELIPTLFPDSQIASNIKCKRTKATCIVRNVLGAQFHEDLVSQLKTSPFSILLDETTDVSTTKQLCAVVRLFDSSTECIASRFFRLYEVSKADAETLFTTVKEDLEKIGIPLNNIIGYAADGANVMMGGHNSVRTRMEELNPHIFTMKCICHSAAICASNACTKLPRDTEDFIREVYSHFSHSAKRLSEYNAFQHFTDTEPHKLLRPCQTRWLSLNQCVQRILEQWDALTEYFKGSVKVDRLLQSERLLSLLQNPHFKLFYQFLAFVLPKFTNFNLLFQSASPNLHKLHNECESLYRDLLSCYMSNSYIRPRPVGDINPNSVEFMLPLNAMYLGVDVMKELSTPKIKGRPDLVRIFLERCRDFFVTAAMEIRQRFPLDDPVIKSLKILDPSFSHTEFPSLVSVAVRFPNLIAASQLQQLDNEWRLLAYSNLPFQIEELPIDQFWGRLSTVTDGAGAPKFAILATLMKGLLSLPHSNADTERVFSAVNLIKTKSRNKLKSKSLEALLLTKEGLKHASTSYSDCRKFVPGKEFLSRMNSSNLYCDNTELDSDSD